MNVRRREGRRCSLARAIVLVLAIAHGFVGVAAAECPEERWLGAQVAIAPEADGIAGSGRGTPDDGIGGSGLTGGGDEDGIGGSGHAPSGDGIGGSGAAPDDHEQGVADAGLFGTLTGFGSLCVNGQRVEYDETVTVRIDGAEASAADLAVGQVVRIVATEKARGLVARDVEIEHAVVGPVTMASSDRFEVMGQRVLWKSEPTRAVAVGERVAVSGLVREDGSIVASRVDGARPDAPDLVRGTLDGEGGAVRVGGARVSLPKADASGRGANRETFAGRWDVATERLVVERRTESPRIPRDARRVDLEGYVRAGEGGALRVGGLVLAGEGGAVGVRPGDRVRVRVERGPREVPPRVIRIDRVRGADLLRGLDRGARPMPQGAVRQDPRGVVPSAEGPDPSVRDRRNPRGREATSHPPRPPRPPKPPPIHDQRRPKTDGMRRPMPGTMPGPTT